MDAMSRICARCGAPYKLRTFHEDAGLCPKCSPRFFSLPVLFDGTPAATQAIWTLTVWLHILEFFVLGVLFIGGPLGYLARPYCLAVVTFLIIRSAVARWRGYPRLRTLAVIAYLLLPVYGMCIFAALYCIAEAVL